MANTEGKLTKKDLLRSWFRWILAVEVPVSFDRMQALAFGFSMSRIMQKLYKDQPDELQSSMERHTSLFNSNCTWGSIIHGTVISMEEQRALGKTEITPEAIQSVKLGLMGPLAGIGDSVDQGIVGTISLAVFVPFALEGSIIAAFMPGIIYCAYAYLCSWWLFNKGYKFGKSSVLEILKSGKIQKLIDAASILGMFMIGCLSASYVKLTTAIEFVSETSTVNLQSILDGILPKMLPFTVIMLMYLYILKKGPKFLQIVFFVMVAGVLLTFLGII